MQGVVTLHHDIGRARPAARPAAGRRRLKLVALLAGLLAAVLLPAACGEAEEPTSPSTLSTTDSPPAAYTDIGPDELAGMLEQKDFVFINTHIPYEGEIEQTDLFLPYDRAAELVDRLPADKDAKIVVYCRSDRMSRIAADEWAAAGYTNLYNLEGGFVAWEAAGYPLLQLERE
jgi:rhodanese-related sulfurtransferase